MNKPIIQSLWIGKELSVLEQLCICSFLKNGHNFHLYTYEKINNVPDGTSSHGCECNNRQERNFYL